ncbi:enoyl-CoA hydratase [Brevibacterium jeotgali]|uniref:Probable enoyl-CoA hydratase echA8 n=1 Tax=Brevibacterium jeotgali TaxID=1262550 RepID=A0A2H1L5I6_9MICO|nr:enoyl-CoA hydratase [Brevibacterium jeotgali]TWB98991.1 short chain enoyl-CoA hydratase [Brevibacterium jeotgali]SMY12177.1 short chain enoyl-CoA hydratase [Brevibacterium jeotgali]
MSTPATYETILVEYADGIATITLNRPDSLNALNLTVLEDVTAAASAADADDGIRAIILTGAGKAFAAGADIKQMSSLDFATAYRKNWFAGWSRLDDVSKPIIAAVNGFALGGGCELAMMADILIASEKAKFGQPEINLGVLPGMGGSQRLTRAIGKAKAMDLCLTGRMMDAEEAERSGLVARVVAHDSLIEEAESIAATVASKSLIASSMVKEAVNVAFETPLQQGLAYERRLFHASLATNDQSEGMAAFVEKRKPDFTDS